MVLNLVLFLIVSYLVAGLVFAIAFVLKGVDAVDEGATGSSIGFRIIIIPGTIVFWPLLMKKWINVKRQTND